jgi:hypothetical protein
MLYWQRMLWCLRRQSAQSTGGFRLCLLPDVRLTFLHSQLCHLFISSLGRLPLVPSIAGYITFSKKCQRYHWLAPNSGGNEPQVRCEQLRIS